MRFTQECPICGGTKISGPHYVTLPFGRTVPVISLPNGRTASLQSLTCLTCGHTQIFVDKKGLHNIREGGKVYKLPEMENEFCPQCGASFEQGLRRCSKCGLMDVPEEHFIEPEPYACEGCGSSLDFGTQTCPFCGYRIS